MTDPVVLTDDPYRCLDGRYHYRCEVGHNVASRSKLTKCPAPVTPVGNPRSCGAEMEHYIVDVEVDPKASVVTAPVLLTDDLTRQVYVTPERLTKPCLRCHGTGSVSVSTVHYASSVSCGECSGSGRVPVEVGDTLELRCEQCDKWDRTKDEYPYCARCDNYQSRTSSVVWEGPAAKVKRSIIPPSDFTLLDKGTGWYPRAERGAVWLRSDLHDELGIGSDPDQWVYLVGEAS